MNITALIVSYQSSRQSFQIGNEQIPFNSGDLGLFLGVILGISMLYLITASTRKVHVKFPFSTTWLLFPLIIYVPFHFILFNWWPQNNLGVFTASNTDFILGLLAGVGMSIFTVVALSSRYDASRVFTRHIISLILIPVILMISLYTGTRDGMDAGIFMLVGLLAVLGFLILLFDATLLTLAVVLDILEVPEDRKDTARAFTGLALLTGGTLLFVLRKALDLVPSIVVSVPWQASIRLTLFQWGSLLILASIITLTITKIKSRAYMEIGRPYMALLGILPILIGMTMTVANLGHLMTTIWSEPQKFLALMIGAFTSVMFTNTYNAVHDHREDAISKPHRPIPSGLMTPREALYLSLVPGIITLALAFLFLDPIFYFLAPAFLFIGWLYSKAHIKGRYVIPYLWMGTGYVMGGMIVGWLYFVELPSTVTWPPPKFWVLTALLGLFAFLGTVMKDLGDIVGDSKVGYKTIPIMHGDAIAVQLVTISLMISPALLLLYMLLLESLARTVAWLFITITVLLPLAIVLTRRLHRVLNENIPIEVKTRKYQSLFMPVLSYHFLVHVTLLFVLGFF